MAGFNISPASLRGSADGLVDGVDRAAAAISGLESKLHGFGAPWGTGLVGVAIGQLYEAIHDMAVGSYEHNAEVISEYAQGLETMAGSLEDQEQDIEAGLVDIGSTLGQTFSAPGRP